MRLCREYGVKLVCFEHGLEGYRITNELVEHGVAISTFADFWAYKWEAYNTMPQAAALCAERGVLVALNSDDPERMRRLFNDAARTVRFGGASEEEAIRMLTVNPAKILGVDKWVGTIEAGKDADLAVFSRHPLDPFTFCEMTMVDGTVYFDRAKYLADRKKAEEEAGKKKEPEKKSGAPPDKGLGTVSPEAPRSGGGPGGSADGGTDGTGSRGPGEGAHSPPPLARSRRGRVGDAPDQERDDRPCLGRNHRRGRHHDRGRQDQGRREGAPGARGRRGHRRHRDRSSIPDSSMPTAATAWPRSGPSPARTTSGKWARENPELRVVWAINPHSVHFGTGRVTGTTTALVAPAGGTFPGISALVKMDGWTVPEMTIKEAATSSINFPMTPRPPKEGAAAQKEAERRRDLEARRKDQRLSSRRRGATWS